MTTKIPSNHGIRISEHGRYVLDELPQIETFHDVRWNLYHNGKTVVVFDDTKQILELANLLRSSYEIILKSQPDQLIAQSP